MARLSQSQLSGFRIGTSPTAEPEPPNDEPRRDQTARTTAPDTRTRADRPVPATAAGTDGPSASSLLGPVPAAPGRSEPRHKVGITLPLELAERVRALTAQGYALTDLVMVAYQDQRDRLLHERQAIIPRRLVRHLRGRSPLTLSLTNGERAAIDVLAERLGRSRSQTIAALLERQVEITR